MPPKVTRSSSRRAMVGAKEKIKETFEEEERLSSDEEGDSEEEEGSVHAKE